MILIIFTVNTSEFTLFKSREWLLHWAVCHKMCWWAWVV